jgi:hypothetical protein
VRNADAVMDHRAAQQVASGARRGADNKLAFHFAWRKIELRAIAPSLWPVLGLDASSEYGGEQK